MTQEQPATPPPADAPTTETPMTVEQVIAVARELRGVGENLLQIACVLEKFINK